MVECGKEQEQTVNPSDQIIKLLMDLNSDMAVGSAKTSFNSNGFYPVDVSQFPMKFRVKDVTWSANA